MLRRYIHGPGVDDPLIWMEGATTALSTRRFLLRNWQGSIVGHVLAYGGHNPKINTYDGQTFCAIRRGRYARQRKFRPVSIYRPDLPARGRSFAAPLFASRSAGSPCKPSPARPFAPLFDPPDQIISSTPASKPIGYDDGPNWYAYVHNDPLNAVDPNGKCSVGPEGEKCWGDLAEDHKENESASEKLSDAILEYNDKLGETTITIVSTVTIARGISGVLKARSLRGVYHARISRIPEQARARGGSLEEQARWAFNQRQSVRAETRKEIDGWINAIFKPKERTFEGAIMKRMESGMSRDQALNSIIDNIAHSNATVDIISGYK